MPGKLCNGGAFPRVRLSNSKAYCEGRHVQADGGALGDNPHLDGSDDFESWEQGFIDEGLGRPAGCCAPTGITPVPPPAATAVLTTAGGDLVTPAVITLTGPFRGTETLNFTSVTDVETTPVVEAIACPVGTAAATAIFVAASLSQVDRTYVANGDTIECLAVAPSATVTLSAVSLS